MKYRGCQVFFVGAGPGDPELITVKGKRCIETADLVLYTGSLVPEEVVSCAKPEAQVLDSSSMTLEETHSLIVDAVKKGEVVARVHTGDPSLYGAVKEQMVLLDREGIAYEVVPGVSAAFAAAAAARISFTIPEATQSLIITRAGGRTKMPEKERLNLLSQHRASMAIYLSTANPSYVQRELVSGGYDESTPVVVAYRVGWPGQIVVKTQLFRLAETVERYKIKRQAVFLVLPGEVVESIPSRLYSSDFTHSYRK